MNKIFAKDEMILGFKKYTVFLIKWLLISAFTGVLVGVLTASLYHLIILLTGVRNKYWFLIFTLPFVGALIAYLYKIANKSRYKDVNMAIIAIHSKDKSIPFTIAPLAYISALLSHIAGASVGFVDASIQVGASIAHKAGELIKLSNSDRRTIIMCAVSGVFSAALGAPLAGTIFAMEVSNVGYMYYAALLPCTIAAIAGSLSGQLLGINNAVLKINVVSGGTVTDYFKIMALGIMCALLVRLFCSIAESAKVILKTVVRDRVKRGLIGGIVLLILALLVGGDYLGLGMDIIEKALGGYARPEAFIIKTLFTAIAIAAGFKGGSIVPGLFIGATFGAFIAPFIGLSAPLCAALAMIGVFCGITNSPLVSVALGVELFGAGSALPVLIVVSLAYALSGYTGMFKEQKLMFSKLNAYPLKPAPKE